MSAEFNRRLDNLIRFGTIAEVDYEKARVRVKSGQILTDFLPFITLRAGTTKTWSPPTVDEQCVILAASGEFTTACVLVGLYTQNSPSHSPDLHVIQFADGATIEYNQASRRLNVVGIKSAFINASEQIDIFCPTVNIKGNVKIDGKVTSTGDMIAGGISQISHKHGGVQGGPSKTGIPE
ncbi:baseplate assembly protein [Rodentibacter trehalosifermentans]|uniref:Baseplate assembly protein n=1 Tax=Rodentibacter trehalosifermentans TaxID=1908263 RepID=A0A1V3J047_9PAST|nr:phage baseplate assembly protein V [Rodentibacter trehalosifermentans]OOF47961.1 baseplate assembly protein [Rodentibacter trehalosifermentans]